MRKYIRLLIKQKDGSYIRNPKLKQLEQTEQPEIKEVVVNYLPQEEPKPKRVSVTLEKE